MLFRSRIDWAGLVIFGGGLFLLVFGLLRGNAVGWWSLQIVGSLAGAGLLLAGFVAVELRGRRPMLDVRLLAVPAFAGASVAAFAIAAGLFSTLLYFVLYLQNVLGYSPLQAGLRRLPITLLAFVLSPLAAGLSRWLPARLLIGVGLALIGGGVLLIHDLQPGSRWTALVGFLLAGAGLVNPVLAEVAIGVLPRAHAGVTAGINNTFREIGVATGIAGLGAVFSHVVQANALPLLAAGPPAVSARAHELAAAAAAGGAHDAHGGLPRRPPPSSPRPPGRHSSQGSTTSCSSALHSLLPADSRSRSSVRATSTPRASTESRRRTRRQQREVADLEPRPRDRDPLLRRRRTRRGSSSSACRWSRSATSSSS